MVGGGCGCGVVVRRRIGVVFGEGGFSFFSDDMVCGWYVFGDVLE